MNNNSIKSINFQHTALSTFALKYLAKFIMSKRIDSISVNGGPMPLKELKTDQLVLLDLKDQNLFAEDLFILSQFLTPNKSVTHVNLSSNLIGFSKHSPQLRKDKQVDFSDQEFNSMGLQHLSLALAATDRIVELDLSSNKIGSSNFDFLQAVFSANSKLQLLNIAECQIDGAQIGKMCGIV